MQDTVTAQIAEQRADLLAFLGGLVSEDWSRPTVCKGWSVKDVLAHLVEGELAVGAVYRREVVEQGFRDPQEGVERWRALPGAAVRAALWQHGIATQRVLDALGEDTRRAPIKAFGCREIGQLVRLHLFDLTVHSHDITDAVGAPSIWAARLPFVVEFVVRAAPPTFARHGRKPEGTLAVRSGGRSWTLNGEGERWKVEPEGEGGTAGIEVDPEDLVLVTTGRREVGEVLGRATVTGDAGFAERLLGSWRVV